MNLAVIPARGGSKRIPQKNIRNFCGRPVIEYSIQAAQQANVFDRIVVSTDCEKIADVAKLAGAEVPFMRPSELANDHTPTIPVIAHAIQWFSEREIEFDYTCCIYATAPFVEALDLTAGLGLLQTEPNLEFAFPVTSFPFPIQRALRLNHDKANSMCIEMFWPQHEQTRSQDLEEAYHDAGQFYWAKSKSWLEADGIYSAKTAPVVIPRYRVQDIDTLEDWQRAEAIYRANEQYPNG